MGEWLLDEDVDAIAGAVKKLERTQTKDSERLFRKVL